MSIIYFDFDNFKEVNGIYGHSSGDNLLKSLADVVKSCLRETNIFARLGDEFSIVLPDTGENETKIISERFRGEVMRLMRKNDWPVTLSIGAITFKKFDISDTKCYIR